MTALFPTRAIVVWALLVAATLGSVAVGHGHHDEPARAATVIVVAIAFAKARLIAGDFMELNAAPRPLRLLVDGWLVLAAALVVAAYLIGTR